MFEGYVSIVYVGVVLLFSLANLLAYADVTPCLFTKSLTRLLIRFTRVVYGGILLLLLLHWEGALPRALPVRRPSEFFSSLPN
jgi:hypothetical protein